MASGNPILDKNLECIKRYNPKLANDLLNLPFLTNKIELTETNIKETNLTFNGLPLHSQNGAEAEAKEIFETTTNTPVSMHIIFGIGLGYLLDEFCDNSKGKVFLIEPNLEIFRVTLEIVDFTKILSKKNVFVFSDIECFRDFFVKSYEYKADVSFKILDSYRHLYSDNIESMFKRIEMIMGGCIASYNTMQKESFNSILMMFYNLNESFNAPVLEDFKDIYNGKTALIVSAGPSLDSNIETIKKHRDKVIVFCVGTALKALINNGITPDFLTIIETQDCSEQVRGFDLSQIDMILEPYTHVAFFKTRSKNKILFPDNSSHANNVWAKLTDRKVSKYQSKGTVSYASLIAAKIFGFSKIILIGQDLAYLNNQCYSKDSPYAELIFETNQDTGKPEFKIRDYDKFIKALFKVGNDKDLIYSKAADEKVKSINDTLYFVKGISGQMIPTQGCYAGFIEYFREFADSNKDLELINSSMIGAQIDGFKNVSLEETLEDAPKIEKIEIEPVLKTEKETLFKNFDTEKHNLLLISRECEKIKEYISKYEKELNRRRTFTQEAQTLLTNAINIYNKITTEHYNKDALFQIVAFNETIEIQHAIKTAEKIDSESSKLIHPLLITYCENVIKKIEQIILLIDAHKGTIHHEIINPKS